MKVRRLLPWVSAVVAIAMLSVAAFAASAAPGKKGAATVRVAVVTDIGGLNDKGFNQLSNVGLQRAIKQLKGIQGRVYVTNSANDRTPNLRTAAQSGYGLVIPVGVLFAFGPIDAVAPSFSNTKFAGIDVNWPDLQSKPRNVRGVQFKEQEAGYLVGYIAGLVVKDQKGPDIISAVGANPVPAIVRFIAGYRAGAKRANKGVKVLVNYAQDPTFADQAKCKETTLDQIDRGSKVAFEVAGACGLGGLTAAKERKIWGIGVDADQYFLGKHILTSATKRVDTAVFDMIKKYKANPAGFQGGFNTTYSVKNNGVGYGRLSTRLSKAKRAEYTRKANVIRNLIAKGKIKPPVK
ncbi:MAG TPA: BMP family ABC transporter substrate-binding protein [Gaiellaceae bacterium]